ncbi:MULTISPECIES: ABC1 kinase family protein [Pacificimonas]|uniref:ABC1 kinase family protein n=1 Tax=Pacificimonas TaxID=1960290 RepID=UPI001CCDF4DA|nr:MULTISPECIES: AarF/ABC1/UbiB kinase family protein [Pacificimonas]
MGEVARLAELGRIFVRHGAGNLAAALGLAGPAEGNLDADRLRPAATVALLRDIGPVGVKLGQLLATRGDLFSQEWIAAFASLHDQVEPIAFELIEPVLIDSWGDKWATAFRTFERTPLASTSIAQTYPATLNDGTDVIVKVRRPGTAARLRADIRLLTHLASLAESRSERIARYRPVEFLRQFGRNLAWELDLAAEARACERIGSLLQTLRVATPAIYWELTSLGVNVQQRFQGVSAAQLNVQMPEARKAAFARRYADTVLRMIIFNGEFHGDPHQGNVSLLDEADLGFIDFGSVGTLTRTRRREVVRLILAVSCDRLPPTTISWPKRSRLCWSSWRNAFRSVQPAQKSANYAAPSRLPA